MPLEQLSRHPVQKKLWGFPAGGKEKGQSFRQTANKELAEEAGLIRKSFDGFNGKKLFGGGGFLFEHIIDEKSLLSFKFGVGLPGMVHVMINYREGRNIFNVGINTLFESSSYYLGYMRAW